MVWLTAQTRKGVSSMLQTHLIGKGDCKISLQQHDALSTPYSQLIQYYS